MGISNITESLSKFKTIFNINYCYFDAEIAFRGVYLILFRLKFNQPLFSIATIYDTGNCFEFIMAWTFDWIRYTKSLCSISLEKTKRQK
ncbi:hypothetical protein NUACC21_13410 [Scytonema sp. NUACC21]